MPKARAIARLLAAAALAVASVPPVAAQGALAPNHLPRYAIEPPADLQKPTRGPGAAARIVDQVVIGP